MLNITENQKKALADIFCFTGETFQAVAKKAGIKDIPDHLEDISYDDAVKIVRLYNVKLPE